MTDGVLDGPVLPPADIGVAMGASGTDLAIEAADLVPLDGQFGSIVVFGGMAKDVWRRRFDCPGAQHVDH